jgi:hypothetical protein
VKIYNQLSAPFEFNKRIKQGDGLSTTLLILALLNAAQEIDLRGSVCTKLSQICASVDYVIVTRLETRLRQAYREIEDKTQQMGLMVNEKKTKYMTVSATQKGQKTQNWKVGDKVFRRLKVNK